MHFVFRVDGVDRGQHDVYVVVADRGDAPPVPRDLAEVEGAQVVLAPAEEVTEIVDDGRGLATAFACATSLRTCDPALIEEGAALGIERAAPTPSVIRTVTASLLSAVWGHQALVVADPTVLLRLVEACARVTGLGPREPLFVAFEGSSNNPAFAPCSVLLYAPLPTGEPAWILVLDAQDLDEVVETLADGRHDELVYFDAMQVSLIERPAFASRLFAAVHGGPAVPHVRRTHLDEPCLMSEADLLTLAAALELYAKPHEVATVAATDLVVTARVADPSRSVRAPSTDADRSGARSV